ncbi:MAG: FYDLN acid domain-containing protein [Defluviitaleaceae bacterium]|nr:FYDLN acid domain-containing protein [Defluviitaleaceae bacterium]
MHWIIMGCIIVVILIYMAIRTSSTHFECPECQEHFRVGFLRYFFAPHTLGRRFVTCPKCGHGDFLSAKPGKN